MITMERTSAVNFPDCPYCNAKVAYIRGGSKNRPIVRLPYCGSCGWNIPFAQKGVVAQLRWTILLMFGFGMFIVAQISVLIATHPPIQWHGAVLLVGFTAMWVFVAYVLPNRKFKRDLRQLAALRAAAEDRSKAGESCCNVVPVPDPATVELFDFIRSTPCPRPVRFNSTARLAVYVSRGFALAYALGAARVLMFPISSLGVSSSRLLAMGLFVFAVVLWFAFSMAAKLGDRTGLIKNGEVALGRVLTREGPRIACEFSDAKGRVVQGEGKILGHNVQEGMFIPVFYDPQNPADHVALCGSWYEIATPRVAKPVRDA
jgi:hypothetical protein